MTKEEIIQGLMDIETSQTWQSEVIYEAIQAIEQEPNCQFYVIDEDGHGLCKYPRCMENTCEDAISRQAVLRMLKGCLTGGETEYEYVKIYIDGIPSVTPIRPKGNDVLDKIRNEITMLHIFNRANVIEIIDKYKSESEEI